MSYPPPPKRLPRRPDTVANVWRNQRALIDMIASADLTDEEARAIARHPSPEVVATLILCRPTLPTDVAIWLSIHRLRLRVSVVGRPELPIERLIELAEVEETPWIRTMMLTRLVHRARTEGFTQEEMARVLMSNSEAFRDTKLAIAGVRKP